MKKFKISKNNVELRFNVTKDFDVFIKLLNLFNLNIGDTICTCSYDKELIDLIIIDGEVNVEVVETEKKFLRTIRIKETDVNVNSVDTLKKLLKISNDYDAILIFKSMNASNDETVFVISDNGHDYINFNKNEYDKNEIKTKISQILSDWQQQKIDL